MMSEHYFVMVHYYKRGNEGGGSNGDYMMIIWLMVIRYILLRLRMNMRKPREGIVVAQAGHSLNCTGEKCFHLCLCAGQTRGGSRAQFC